MYLFLGTTHSIRTEDLVAVCDLDNVTASPRTRKSLDKAAKSGALDDLCDGLPLSLVVCAPPRRKRKRRGGGRWENRLLLSPLTPGTIARRVEQDHI